MFTKVSHSEGIKQEEEILFSTPFNYMFPEAARSRLCLLPNSETTQAGLRALAVAMADNGAPGNPLAALDSSTPAAFTYLGQFIDHDLTARTDRDGSVSMLGRGEPIAPLDPDLIVRSLRNGRRPQLDLDSVFGDGPGLAGPARTSSQVLYDGSLRLVVFEDAGRTDLPRVRVIDAQGGITFPATIADGRNDENINISQLHTLFLRFYNRVHGLQAGTDREKYIRARQLVRWAYQTVVVRDYLKTVCDRLVVEETLANGPRFMGPTAGHGTAFMPLEFSVAAFRFGHSMIRPFYRLNGSTASATILELLGTNAVAGNFAADNQLTAARVLAWENFVNLPGSAVQPQRARKIDTKIAHDLFTLPFRPDDPVLTNLAESNLFRGFSLSIPTGQAVCDAMGVDPLTPSEILGGEDPAIAAAIAGAYFHHRTPLWYYVLREAAVQQDGERLGELGSRLVAETVIGLLKQDPNSYLNNRHDRAVRPNGIDLTPAGGGPVIRRLRDIVAFVQAP